MDSYSEPVVDRLGNVMFWCDDCRAPITRGDILDLGLRLPDFGETADEYLDTELIDAFRHPRCITVIRAG
jgi:hypothetical protein